jgi:hypothetical protein
MYLEGTGSAKLFKPDATSEEISTGTNIDFLNQ